VNDFLAIPAAMDAFAATCHAAGDTICSAGSADSEAMLAAAAAALGPIGASYLPAYVEAQTNCLDATLQVGQVHHATGAAAQVCRAAIVAADHA